VTMVVGMNSMRLKVIGKIDCLWVRSLLGYQRTLDPRDVQTHERTKSQKNKGVYEGEKGKCAL